MAFLIFDKSDPIHCEDFNVAAVVRDCRPVALDRAAGQASFRCVRPACVAGAATAFRLIFAVPSEGHDLVQAERRRARLRK